MYKKENFKWSSFTIVSSMFLIIVYVYIWAMLGNPNVNGEVMSDVDLFCWRLIYGLVCIITIIILFVTNEYFEEKERELVELQSCSYNNIRK